jgi:hypothetical protein
MTEPIREVHECIEAKNRKLGAVEPASALLRGLREFEDHGERRLVREARLAADRAMAHRAKGLPIGFEVRRCLGWEVAEGQLTAAVVIRRNRSTRANVLARLRCDAAEAQQSEPQKQARDEPDDQELRPHRVEAGTTVEDSLRE